MPDLLFPERLGAYVSGIFGGGDLSCINRLHCDALSNEVVLDIDMFGVRVVHRVFSKKQHTVVVNEQVGGVGGSFTKLVE